MNKVLIATLGTRDIQLEKEYGSSDNTIEALESFLEKNNNNNIQSSKIRIRDVRNSGKILLDNYDKVKNYLSLPILEPTLKYLQNADLLIIVATDQPEEHPNDTLYFAEIAKKWIIQHYANQFPNIDILIVDSSDVIRLDSMYDYFAKKFNEEPLKNIADAEELYLHLVGGIDALNNALRLTCMYLYPEKLKPELHVNESNSSVISIRSFSRFLSAQNLRLAEKFAERYDYAAITQLIVISKKIRRLAEYAQHRLAFNFEKCNDLLKNDKKLDEDLRNTLINQVNFDRKNIEGYMKELYHNMYIKYQQESYVDFLSRLFRLFEAYLLYKVSQITHIEYNENKWKENFENHLKQEPDLESFLKEPFKENGNSIQLKYLEEHPSTLTLLKILEYYTKNQKYEAENFKLLTSIRNLSNLRNKSIAAHDFNAVTKEEIVKRIAPLEIDGFFNKLKELLKIKDDDNPYYFINKKIKDMIERSLKYEQF